MQPKILYVVVRRDLTPSQSAVQAGHALAEYMLKCGRWANTTLVYLGVDNLFHLEKIKYKLEYDDIKYYEFREPDINNEPTAIASDVQSRVFENLDLL